MSMRIITWLMLALVCFNMQAAEFDSRAAFGMAPARDVDAALKRAAKDKKQVVLFGFDPKADGSFPGYMIAYFMELAETKKLVKDNFIVVVLERGHKDLERYPNPGPPEKPYYALLRPDGNTAKTEMVYANSSVGLKTVKEWPKLP